MPARHLQVCYLVGAAKPPLALLLTCMLRTGASIAHNETTKYQNSQ
jgi:hypothetical protein